VVFLDQHGWSWGDLLAAPDRIVQGMKLLDRKRAEHATHAR